MRYQMTWLQLKLLTSLNQDYKFSGVKKISNMILLDFMDRDFTYSTLIKYKNLPWKHKILHFNKHDIYLFLSK